MRDPGVTASLLRRRARADELWVPVHGRSMAPRYRSGSRVLVVVPDRAPRTGDVWAFCRRDGEVVVHRFLARSHGRFVFRGDAEPRADLSVPAGWLVGVVREVDDGTRYWRPRLVHAVLPLVRAGVRRVANLSRRLPGR